jgi:hypothetical protein
MVHSHLKRELGACAGKCRRAEVKWATSSGKVGLIVDFNSAKALGLTLPETLLAIANEVIE